MTGHNQTQGFPPPPAGAGAAPTGGWIPPGQQPAWEELPPATAPQPSAWGAGEGQQGWGQPATSAPQGWGAAPTAAGQGWGGGHQLPPPSRPKGMVPVWVAVLIGVLAFVVGGAIGGFAGFVGGAAVTTGELSMGGVGADAVVTEAPVGAEPYEVGPFTVTNVRIESDFADDFEVQLDLTNHGDSYGGGFMEVVIRRGNIQLGSVSSSVEALERNETTTLHLIGFDDYDHSYDTIELRIDP